MFSGRSAPPARRWDRTPALQSAEGGAALEITAVVGQPSTETGGHAGQGASAAADGADLLQHFVFLSHSSSHPGLSWRHRGSAVTSQWPLTVSGLPVRVLTAHPRAAAPGPHSGGAG